MFALLMGLKTISPAKLHQLVQSGAATVMDVNSHQSWSKAHVQAQATWIHLPTAKATCRPTKPHCWCSIARIQCA